MKVLADNEIVDRPNRRARLRFAVRRYSAGWIQFVGIVTLSGGFGWLHPWLGVVVFGFGLVAIGVARELGQS